MTHHQQSVHNKSAAAEDNVSHEYPERILELIKYYDGLYFLITNLPAMNLKELIDWHQKNQQMFSARLVVKIMLCYRNLIHLQFYVIPSF